jgi:hypothetical protein
MARSFLGGLGDGRQVQASADHLSDLSNLQTLIGKKDVRSGEVNRDGGGDY